jgi:hypothetical protein
MPPLMPSIATPGLLGLPPPTGTYTTYTEYKSLLQAYRFDYGFAIASDNYVAGNRAAWICTRSGKYDNKGKDHDVHPTKRRRNTSTTKIGCPFRIRATFALGINWTIYIVDSNHNHEPATVNAALPQYRLPVLTPAEHAKY